VFVHRHRVEYAFSDMYDMDCMIWIVCVSCKNVWKDMNIGKFGVSRVVEFDFTLDIEANHFKTIQT